MFVVNKPSPKTFGRDDLKRLVEWSVSALKQGDKYLRVCGEQYAWKDCEVGLKQIENERYYQSIIWLYVRRVSQWWCGMEDDSVDLTFYDGERPIAFCELKLWWDDSGRKSIPWIKKDITKLQLRMSLSKFPNVTGVMLIVSWTNPPIRNEVLEELAGNVKISVDSLEVGAFDTTPWNADKTPVEMLVIGFIVYNPLPGRGKHQRTPALVG